MTNSDQTPVDWAALRDAIAEQAPEQRASDAALYDATHPGTPFTEEDPEIHAVRGGIRYHTGPIPVPFQFDASHITGITYSDAETIRHGQVRAIGTEANPHPSTLDSETLREEAITRIAEGFDVPRNLIDTDIVNRPMPGAQPPLLSLGQIAVHLRELTEMIERHMR